MGAEIEQGRENRAKEIEYTMELNKKAYDKYIKQITPVNELGSDMLRAFVTGGIICALGQDWRWESLSSLIISRSGRSTRIPHRWRWRCGFMRIISARL